MLTIRSLICAQLVNEDDLQVGRLILPYAGLRYINHKSIIYWLIQKLLLKQQSADNHKKIYQMFCIHGKSLA